MTSFIRGGRISKASGVLGTALKICPLMNVDNTGHLIPREKIRTKKRAIAQMVKTCMEHIDDGAAYTGKVCMSQSACRADAEAVADALVEQMPQLAGKIDINDIGTVIGSHTGPGTVALFFMGDARVDRYGAFLHLSSMQEKAHRYRLWCRCAFVYAGLRCAVG